MGRQPQKNGLTMRVCAAPTHARLTIVSAPAVLVRRHWGAVWDCPLQETAALSTVFARRGGSVHLAHSKSETADAGSRLDEQGAEALKQRKRADAGCALAAAKKRAT